MNALAHFDAHAPVANSFATILEAVRQAPDLQPQSRRSLISAVNAVVKILAAGLETLPYQPGLLREQIDRLTRQQIGCSPMAWRRTLRLFDEAALLAGLPSLPSRSKAAVSEAWAELLTKIDSSNDRCSIRRLARFCTEAAIEPDAVDDAVMALMSSHLATSTLARPVQTCRDVVKAWNRLAARTGSGQNLELPRSTRKSSLPLSAFAPSFAADVEAYLSHIAGADLMSDTADRPASPATIKVQRERIRRLGTVLVRQGRDPLSIANLADLVSLETAKTVLSAIWLEKGKASSGDGYNLARLVQNIARHWVKSPAVEVDLLKKLVRRFQPKRSGMTDKNRTRLRSFADPSKLRALVTLPKLLLAGSLGRAISARDAVEVQTAVAVAILLVAPIRVKNLAELHLEKSFLRPGSRSDSPTHLVVEAFRVKNKQRIELVLPLHVTELIEIYTTRFRPLLAPASNPWLFPNTKGGHKTPAIIGAQIPKVIEATIGLNLNPHLFRHLSAYIFLKKFPGEYETVRRLLGHTNVKTTMEFYCGLEQNDAFLRLDAILDDLRSDAGALQL